MKVLTAKVRLLWKSTYTVPGCLGVWGEAWVDVNLEQIANHGEIDEDALDVILNCDYDQMPAWICKTIESYLGEGGLPAGTDLCSTLGLPSAVYLIDLEWEEREEGDNDAIL